MSEVLTSAQAIEQAAAALQRKAPPEDVLALLGAIAPDAPEHARAQYFRGLCALSLDDAETARGLLADAIQRGERDELAFLSLGLAARKTGLPADSLALLLDVLKRIAPAHVFKVTQRTIGALGFRVKEFTPENETIFQTVLLPLLAALLERRDMDNAIALEDLIYEIYVKAAETEAHFEHCIAQMAPLFAAAGRDWRARLAPLPEPALTAPYKVGFFIHSASMLAHVEVLLNMLKGYRQLEERPFTPTVYCMAGKSVAMEQALAALGVRLVMLNERFPEAETSFWQRLLRLRELIAEDGVQELVWVSLVTMMPLAFGMRIARVQTWFAMKYHNLWLDEIDGYVSTGPASGSSQFGGRTWRTALLGAEAWHDPSRSAEAARIRASIDARVVLMTLARTEKMQDPAYLDAVTTLLKTHPDTVFLWAGKEESAPVVAAFEAAGVLDRTRFLGWVDTLLYAQVGDIFLDTFPFPCGFTLVQSLAAGKPTVFFDTPEARQGFIFQAVMPLLEGKEGTEQARAELREILGPAEAPSIPIVSTPQDYVRWVGRLIEDEAARASAGASARRFVNRYFSDTREMARVLSRHFVELIEERSPSTISEEYRELQRKLHENPNYGVASIGFAPLVKQVIDQTNAKSLSDYGAGKQNLRKALFDQFKLELDYRPYDPAFPEYGEPRPADLVCCLDVLEHIEPDFLDRVLDDLKRITVRDGLFSIHTGPAVKVLADGRNAHLIQKPSSWWLPKLCERFEIANLWPTTGGFLVAVSPRLPHN